MKKYDVVALGELLIDFTENGISGQGNPIWEANPGGAPCNLLAMLAKLGRSVAFIGKVGDDVYGRQLTDALTETGINTTGLLVDKEVHTTLAIVGKKPNGDRDFAFYRDPGADMMLTVSDLPLDLIKSARIFHFGTLSMTDEGVREATKAAVKTAKESGALISFDPNLRPPLWKSESSMKEQMVWGLGKCDVLKISDNELHFFTGETDFEKGANILRTQYQDIKLISVTAGPDGSYTSYKNMFIHLPTYDVKTIETTGAGDTYGACVLNYILDHGIDGLTEENVVEMMRFASAAASLITTRRGALRVMPSFEEINDLMKTPIERVQKEVPSNQILQN